MKRFIDKVFLFSITIALTALHSLQADPIPTRAQLHRCVQESPGGVIPASQNDADTLYSWIMRSQLDQLAGEELRELLRPGRITEVESAIFNLRAAFDPRQIFDDGSYRRREQIHLMRQCERWVVALTELFNERVARLKPLLNDYRREPGGDNGPYYRDATLTQDSDVYSDEAAWHRVFTLRSGAKVRMIVPYVKIKGNDRYQKVVYTDTDGNKALGWVLRRNLLPEQR